MCDKVFYRKMLGVCDKIRSWWFRGECKRIVGYYYVVVWLFGGGNYECVLFEWCKKDCVECFYIFRY